VRGHDGMKGVIRYLALALVLLVGLLAGASALADSVRRLAPAQAIALDGSNVAALNRLAALQVRDAPDATAKQREAALRYLERSLEASLLNPVALRLAGLFGAADSQHPSAKPFMQIATELSRRDVGAHAWLALDAARNGRVDQALDHIDYALRTSPAAADNLFAVLVKALPDPAVQRRIPELAAADVVWIPRFLDAALYGSEAPELVARIVARSGGFPKGSTNERVLLRRLVAEGHYDAALRYASTLEDNATAIARSAELDEAKLSPRLEPISWSADPESAAFERRPDNSLALVGAVGSDRTAVLATKLLYARPGALVLRGKVSFAETPARDSLQIEAGCPTASGTHFVLQGQPITAEQTNEVSWSRTISLACNPRSIRFVLTSPLESGGNEVVVSDLSIAGSSR
jgi:tetratricopeptide (TPR) repeat protein